MTADYTDLQLLHELEPVVETLVDRHMSMRKDWNPHDYIPWKEGKNYYALGGQDWDPDQAKLSEVAQTAMVQNLLTEDNLPSYHREIAMNFSMDGPWGFWVNRWTAEENRHGIVMRDYLVVTQPKHILTAPVNTLVLASSALLIIGIVAVALLAWILSRQIVKPVRSVSNGFRHLRNKDSGVLQPLGEPIHGRLDQVCPPANAGRIHARIKGSRLVWIDGCGHEAFHPAMVAAWQDALNTVPT